jgi:tetratricopeptide (TPR) repeat protein
MVGRSLALWVWPWPLGLDHPLTFLSRFDAVLAVALVSGAVGCIAAVVWLVRRAPIAAWGLLWAIAGLLPLAPLPWLTTVALLQEHRMGLSAAGLSWTTAVLAREIWMGSGRRRAARVLQWTFAGVGVVLVLIAVAVDRQRSAVWNDDRRLWAEVVQRSPDNLLARINLGSAYMMRRDYERAESEFRTILTLVPTYYKAYDNLGLVALRQNRPDEARTAFQRAAELNPQDPDAHTNLGILALRAGDTAAAEASFRAALAINPTERDALNNLATMYLQRREWAVALDLVTRALRRTPEFLEASYNQGIALAGLGRHAEAAVVLRDIRGRLSPDPSFDQYRQAIDRLLAGGLP